MKTSKQNHENTLRLGLLSEVLEDTGIAREYGASFIKPTDTRVTRGAMETYVSFLLTTSAAAAAFCPAVRVTYSDPEEWNSTIHSVFLMHPLRSTPSDLAMV
jgi:hypothetical protein